ncbi:autotransporter outer membrane beta-barrel domain-containing protein [Lysobacter arenosi]|uniref:Autotransporter outer membrane beta-barrel domain-containing protein n=1 Tax=Lysobacter arenosi TaxID=2795387 RepID=A0ABX7R5V2_9GAMM|nr:autotransporter outer membrane beta-barrel domain-containing protein [Lysobacter arenosi]QSX73493.1 autotransporter outer membrane beta-barrel domain-containing protein [Lysobacter arenosi]
MRECHAGRCRGHVQTGQPTTTGDRITCTSAPPDPFTVPIIVGSSSVAATGVTIEIQPGATLRSASAPITVLSNPSISQAAIINNGTIEATGSGYAINASQTESSLINGGVIRAADGVAVGIGGRGPGSLQNLASGVISGTFGVQSNWGTIINEGLIEGRSNRAFQAPLGTSVSIVNSGLMRGLAVSGSVVRFNNGVDTFTSAGTSSLVDTSGASGTGGVDGATGVDTFIFDRSQDSTITHKILNFEKLIQTGPSRVLLDTDVILIGSSSETTIDEGTLAIAPARTLATGIANLLTGATLEINGTFRGIGAPSALLGSSGAETVIGNGLVDAVANLQGGDDTFVVMDGLTASAGTTINGGAGIDTILANIAGNAVLGPLPAFEILIKQGTGTLTLADTHPFSTSSVDAGRLLVNGALPGDVSVAAGATLGGVGTLGAGTGAAQTSLATGAHLTPGTSPGTLRMDSLQLDAGALLDYELGLPGVVGGSQNDLVEVVGNLTLDGTLNLFNMGGMSPGVYRLINYGGTLVDNGLDIGTSLPTRFVPGDFAVDTSTAGQVNLLAQSGGFALQFWDGANTAPNGAVDGGDGTWTAAPTTWTGVDGVVNAPWQSGFAVFQGAAGTVTMGEDIALQGMQFRSGGYTIEGAGFTLAGEPETVIQVDTLVTATVDAAIVDGSGGPARLVKNGPGLLVLGGSSTYSGGTSINSGAVQVASDANLGDPTGAVALNSAMLITTGSFGSARAITIGADGGSIATEGSASSTLSGVIDGPGVLSKVGTGTLVLAGSNNYQGGTFLGNGVLQAGSDGNLGAPGAGVELGGGTFQFGAGFDLARTVTLGELGGTVDTQGFTATFAEPVIGPGSLTKTGTGTLILARDSNYLGATTIASGTLQIGNGGAGGSVPGDVTNNGAVVVNRSDAVAFGGIVSGSGSLTQAGTGTLMLGGDNTYTGGTTIATGTLQLGTGGTSGSVIGDIVNHGTLAIDRDGSASIANAISGEGGVRILGPGTITLTGANSYSGGTVVEAGVLSVGADPQLGDATGGVTLDGGTLLLSAAFDSARPFTLGSTGGTIEVTSRNKLTGTFAGGGNLTKTGNGALILNGDTAYSGDTLVTSGTLVVGDSQHLQARLSGGGNVVVAAAASFGGYGTVLGSVDNRGTLGVGNALAALATQPDAEFNVQGPLRNSGTVTMVNGVAVDRLNVSGSYVSDGGRLALEAVLDQGGTAAQADRLVAGSVELAGGATTIALQPVGGAGAFTNGDGIMLVQVADAARSAPGAFVLEQRVVVGPHEYLLFQGGVVNPADGDWYLRNTAPEVLVPIFRPEVGAYLGNRHATAASLVHTMHERLGEAQYAQAASDKDGLLGSAWVRVRGGNIEFGAGDGSIDLEGDSSLLQAGAELAQWGLLGESDRLHLGGMLAHARSDTRASASFNPARAKGDTEGTLAGFYATWFANDDNLLGAYLDAWAQYGWFDNRIRSDGLPDVNYDSSSWAVSLEYGHALAVGSRLVIEPQVQVIYSDYSADPVIEDSGTVVHSLDDSQTLGRVGLRAYQPRELTAGLQPFVEINWWHGDSGALAFNAVSVASGVPEDRYAVNAGLQGILGDGWNLWMQLGGEWGEGGYDQVNGQIGVKYGW